MKMQIRSRSISLCVPGSLLAGLLLLGAFLGARAQQAPETAPRTAPTTPVHMEGVIHVVGFDDKSGGVGDLSVDAEAITLHVHGKSPAILLDSILAFSTAHGDKPLLNGAKSQIAQAAPYGIGFAVTMTRPKAETLTLLYKDRTNAIHGTVLVLPKDADRQFASAMRLQATNYPRTGAVIPADLQQAPYSAEPTTGATKPEIEVAIPSESIDGIPSAVPVTIYEEVIEQLTQSGLFAHVWRAGDVRRPATRLILHLDLDAWKQGNARSRGFGPLTGATQIQSGIKLEDNAGHVVFEGSSKGSKRMKGENLDATIGLAKHVRKALEKAPGLQSKS